MTIYTPYTYLIGWTDRNKYYYGVRYAQNCHPNDFWVSYHTSSVYVKEHRELYGEPDIIQIRKTFIDKHIAIEWEHKVLKRMDVISDNRFLNKSAGRPIGGHNKGKLMPEKQKEKIRLAHLGKKHSKEHIANYITSRTKKVSKPLLPKTCPKCNITFLHKKNKFCSRSCAHVRTFTPEYRYKLSEKKLGTKLPEKTKFKISESLKKK